MKKDMMRKETLFEKNIEELKKNNFVLYKSLNSSFENNKFEKVECKDGNITLLVTGSSRKLFLHSKYDPVNEAVKFAKEKMQNQSEINIIYGFGMGYHLLQMQKLLANDNEVYVFEANLDIFKEALVHNDLSNLFQDERFHLCITSNIEVLTKAMADALSKPKEVNFILHLPSVQIIPDELEEFKFAMENWNLQKIAFGKYGDLLTQNYLSNRVNIKKNIGELFGEFKDIPFLIVSAGPSLDKNIHLINKIKNKAVIMCVGSAVKALLKKGVTPDMFVISDGQEMVKEQVLGLEDLDIPGIFLSTASRHAVEAYNGPKFIALQEKEYAANEIEKNYIISTGGSVSTTALDIAIRLGANPIIMAGQDLAFTDNRQHVSGYVYNFNEYNQLKGNRTVAGQNGELLYTTLGFLSIKKWIEDRIKEEKCCTFINASEGGAFISGAEHLTLKDTIKKYATKEYNISEIIANLI